MSRYEIDWRPSALRSLRKLDPLIRGRILKSVNALSTDPRPNGAEAIQGKRKGHLRIRVGDYRVIYTVKDDQIIVLVTEVGKRGEVYRGL